MKGKIECPDCHAKGHWVYDGVSYKAVIVHEPDCPKKSGEG